MNGTWGSTTPNWSVLLPGRFGSHQGSREVSDSESRLSDDETDVEGAMGAPTGGCASSHRGGTVKNVS